MTTTRMPRGAGCWLSLSRWVLLLDAGVDLGCEGETGRNAREWIRAGYGLWSQTACICHACVHPTWTLLAPLSAHSPFMQCSAPARARCARTR